MACAAECMTFINNPNYVEENDGKRRRIDDYHHFAEGDIVKFTICDIDDDILDEMPVGRTISTYGHRTITPYDFDFWKVTGVSQSIPHQKGRGVSLSKENVDKMNPDNYLHLVPVNKTEDGFVELDGSENSMVFWYLNLNTNLICQYEDGCPQHAFTDLTIVF